MKSVFAAVLLSSFIFTQSIGAASAVPTTTSGVRARCFTNTRVAAQLIRERVLALYTTAGHTGVAAAVVIKAKRTVAQPVTSANLVGVKSIEFKGDANGGAQVVGDGTPIAASCAVEATATIKVKFTPKGATTGPKIVTTTQQLTLEGQFS